MKKKEVDLFSINMAKENTNALKSKRASALRDKRLKAGQDYNRNFLKESAPVKK
jgi:hypothetical protein